MRTMWALLEDGDDRTLGHEVPGVGVIVATTAGACFVPGARLRGSNIVREDRTHPPISQEGATAEQIRAKQPLVVDPGALSYGVFDDGAADW